jgi:hypothetical protein
MNQELSYQSGLSTLKKIQCRFPNLKMELKEDAPYVDINLDIPKQEGLSFSINLNLQNDDELHLQVGKLWMCWFPCTEAENVEDFIQSVVGLIEGKHRILETIKGGKVVKGQLQIYCNGEWESKSSGIATFYFPSLRRKCFNILQNSKSP